MRPPTPRKLLAVAVASLALGGIWHFFAPAALGGSTTYVVTTGISMEPHFHAGDLVLVRAQRSYRVGEVVAYHNTMLHTIVLHRIVGRVGSRYVFKGDNNDFTDFEYPSYRQLIGALWLHLPGLGADLRPFRSPVLIGVLTAMGTLFFAGGAFVRRRRRRRRRSAVDDGDLVEAEPAVSAQQPPRRHHALRTLDDSVVLALVSLAPFVALAALAFTRPGLGAARVPIPYAQHVRFSYYTRAGSGRGIHTGAPISTQNGDPTQLRVAYSFSAAARHTLEGTIALDATLSSTSGWRRSIRLGRPQPFRGNHAVIHAWLGIAALNHLDQSTEGSGTDTLRLGARVAVSGIVGGTLTHTTFSPSLPFSVTPLELIPVTATNDPISGAAVSANAFLVSARGAVRSARREPESLPLVLFRLPVLTARWIALIGLATAAAAVAATLRRARRFARDEAAMIRHRYGRLLVSVSQVTERRGVPVLEVVDFASLVRIAEHSERMILHEQSDESESFWVADDSAQFRYSLAKPVAGPTLFDYDKHGRSEREIFAELQSATPVQAPAPGRMPPPGPAPPPGRMPPAQPSLST